MEHRYVLEMLIKPGAQPKIEIFTPDEVEAWPDEFMRGVDEMLSLMTELYGKELVQPIAARHAK